MTRSPFGTGAGVLASGTVISRRPTKAPSKKHAPTRSLERELWDLGHDVVVGVDEVGRGAWAGPLSVGAAVLPRDRRVNGVRDSKMLTERERERLFDRVGQWCQAWGVGHASQAECDELGMAAGAAPGHPPGVRRARRDARRGDRRRHLGLRVPAGAARVPAGEGRCRAASPLPRRASSPRCRATGSCAPKPSTTRRGRSTPTRATPARTTSPRSKPGGRRPSTVDRGCSWTTSCRGRASGGSAVTSHRRCSTRWPTSATWPAGAVRPARW